MQAKSRSWMVLVPSVVAVLVAAIHFGPSWLPKTKPVAVQSQTPTATMTIAGRVVDSITNLPVAGADISVDGKPSGYVSENNGNFSFAVQGSSLGTTARLRVEKQGYKIWDRRVNIPSEDDIIQLVRSK